MTWDKKQTCSTLSNCRRPAISAILPSLTPLIYTPFSYIPSESPNPKSSVAITFTNSILCSCTGVGEKIVFTWFWYISAFDLDDRRGRDFFRSWLAALWSSISLTKLFAELFVRHFLPFDLVSLDLDLRLSRLAVLRCCRLSVICCNISEFS